MAYNFDHFLIRYGELSLKGKNRKVFIKKLLDNTKKALAHFPSLTYEAAYDRMYVYLNGQDPQPIEEILSKVFGISSFSLAMKVPTEIKEMKKAALESIQDLSVGTFKVKARRHDKLFPMVSDQINREIATEILKNTDWKVNVKNPDVEILVEVRQEGVYIMTGKVHGAGGYPVGVGGKAMVLLSGGIDSPVASWLVMKRGIAIECIHFAAPPYTSEKAQEKVALLAQLLAPYQGQIKLHIVPFTTLQLAIYHYAPESYAITLMRRMMMRISSGLAQKRHCLAIGTGESVGQVASQTLESMYVINNVTTTPILRPVVCMDKIEIIDIAKKINTYDTSILPFEDCCTIFTPKSPVTKPRLEKCEEYETKWDWQSMVQDCIEGVKTLIISSKGVEETIESASTVGQSEEIVEIQEEVEEDLF